MFSRVPVSDGLLEFVNTKTWAADAGAGVPLKVLVLTGVVTLIGLVSVIVYRLVGPEEPGNEITKMGQALVRVFQSTLVSRLCLLLAAMVIPLIFYVNNKEHYWTAKHTTMLFTGVLGLASWLVVSRMVPRFRVPYAWPVSLILIGAIGSTLCAVNAAEGIGYLFAIFGSAVFMFVAIQVFTTSKRIHLLVLTMVMTGLVLALYGLAQSYILLPMDIVYAHETRAPVSTIGNKNYAAYYLDLVIPLSIALAASRRNPLQTLFALTTYFFCRWHFVLCDTRGGTISMTLGILLALFIVYRFHRRRFRLLLYPILLEPLLWAAMNASKIIYGDIQNWGKFINRGPEKKAITNTLREILPDELIEYRSHIAQWFFKGNEYFLGNNVRMAALVGGAALALLVFWILIKWVKDWRIHLGAACVLALLPFCFAKASMPDAGMRPGKVASEIMAGLERANLAQEETATRLLQPFVPDLVEVAKPYQQLFLEKHTDVAAMFSLTLFVIMATFLLYRWYDQKGGWAPSLATVGATGIWFLGFLFLRSESSVWKGFGTPISSLWPKQVATLHEQLPLFSSLFLNVGAFALASVVSLVGMIALIQYLPEILPKERTRLIWGRVAFGGKIAAGMIVVLVVFSLWTNPRIQRIRTEFVSTLFAEETETESGRGRFVGALFAGAHAYFNTTAKFEDSLVDNPIGFRLEIYRGCLRKIYDNPVFGIGPGNFKIIHPYPKYETALERRILGKEVLGRKAHNDFLEDAVENGFFGLLGIFWMFTMAGFLIYKTLRLIHPARNATDVFTNAVTWGLAWALIAIFMHAQFEAPLLQPASTYAVWVLFAVIYQLYRVQKRRIAHATAGNTPNEAWTGSAASLLSGDTVKSAAVYELPAIKNNPVRQRTGVPIWTSWALVVVIVPLLMGGVLVRQFVGEMWLRWGMIFSDRGVEMYDKVFTCMEKSQSIYPQQMETNYITGRYCIDAVTKVFPQWRVKYRPDLYPDPKRQEKNDASIERLRFENKLDVDSIQEYALLGIDLHKRDIFMNPNYKWAHNNMGVLYDKLHTVNEELADVEEDPEKKAEYLRISRENELESRSCYNKALEIDDLQVYALYNLGQGALRDRDFGLAAKYFSRTYMADPTRGDVNFFLGKCYIAIEELENAVSAFETLYQWMDSSKRNVLEKRQSEELEQLLLQIGNFHRSVSEPRLAARAAKLLVDRFDKCEYLPRLAHASVNLGEATKALEYASEALSECGTADSPVQAEVVYSQGKASIIRGDNDTGLSLLKRLMQSNAGDIFRKDLKTSPVFDSIRDSTAFQQILEKKPAPKKAKPPASKPSAPKPEEAPQE